MPRRMPSGAPIRTPSAAEDQARRPGIGEQAQNRLARALERDAEIEAQHARHVVDVLDPERLIEPEPRHQLGADGFRQRHVVAVERAAGDRRASSGRR